jgi:radical SAM protein with 4Fe4S-binding SPASM domain
MNILDFKRKAFNLLVLRRYPASIVHFVTKRCNGECPHCFIKGKELKQGTEELTLNEIEKVTKKLGPYLANVNLTGGEPFMHKGILDIGRFYFKNSNIYSLHITTNGSYPKRILYFAEKLTREYPNKKIVFTLSIDNFAKEHDKTRKIPNLFEKVIESYSNLKLMGPEVIPNINITISEMNYKIVSDLYHYLCEDYNIRSITTGPVRDQGVYRTPVKKKRLITQSYYKLHNEISRDMEIGKMEGFDRRGWIGRILNQKNLILFQHIYTILNSKKNSFPCCAAALFGVIMPDGSVFPCEGLNQKMGNLRNFDYNLTALWKSEESNKSRFWIKDNKCQCSYECVWTFNILSSWRYQCQFLAAALCLVPQKKNV